MTDASIVIAVCMNMAGFAIGVIMGVVDLTTTSGFIALVIQSGGFVALAAVVWHINREAIACRK